MDGKLYSVQYLRGLAALVVVVAHAGAHGLGQSFYVFDRLGQLGVTLFFVISGFIMVAITGPGRITPHEFLKRRVIRIVPLYWIFTTLAAILAALAPSLFRTTVFTWPHYLQSLAFIPHEAPGRGGTSPLLSLGWTLNYEMIFYLAFALCAPFTARARVVTLTVAFAGLAATGIFLRPSDSVLAFYANVSLLAFTAGTWIGLSWVEGRFRKVPPRGLEAMSGLAVLALVVAFGFDQATESLLSFAALIGFSTLLLVAGLGAEQRLSRVPLLEKIGDASYAIYLVHMFVVGAVVALVSRLLDPAWPLTEAGILVVALVVATASGILVHDHLERPLLRLFRGRRQPRPGTTAMPVPGNP